MKKLENQEIRQYVDQYLETVPEEMKALFHELLHENDLKLAEENVLVKAMKNHMSADELKELAALRDRDAMWEMVIDRCALKSA